MFRVPESPGQSPRLSKRRAQALRRKDRFPKLPLVITLRETGVALVLHWRHLLALTWLTLLVYVAGSFVFTLLGGWLDAQAGQNFALYLVQAELLALMRAALLEFVLVGFYALAVFRLMLLGEGPEVSRYSDAWLRRYILFLLASLRAIAWPMLAFLPYVLFIGLQVYWAQRGFAPGWIPEGLVTNSWPTILLKTLCGLGFYVLYARFVFVQPATAVDVPYSPRESWRVTNWVWHMILALIGATLGAALLLNLGLLAIWPAPGGVLGAGTMLMALVISCTLWLLGVTASVVAFSIAFCLRTGWRPGAQKLSLQRRPKNPI